ncbi:class I SAM-dependent methyltransferase [Halofilum ochraceum]|uniref:class I SAM-dependent methyltransferase n=1 Tax=Halofilum ochraceum TaxID=1611323 RepID=UPI0008D9C16D|nr:class I SAM-dependent methyltransferase [Halofilum ochraceum]
MTAASATDPWDRYWAYGNLHSFSQVTQGNYGGDIAAFWREQFAALPDGACIVDVATGNGAVALLALDTAAATGREFTVHGTDLAAIDPVTQVPDGDVRERLASIHFHPRTPAEALPFADATFDLVCSQFGLEYSDTARSIPELARVLRSGGRAALIVHHGDSSFVRAAREEAQGIDYVLDDARIYLKTRNFLRALAEKRTPGGGAGGTLPPKAAKKRRAVDEAIESIQTAARGQTNPRALLGPLNYVQEVLAMTGQVGAKEALGWLEEARQRVVSMRQRLADMQAAACAEEDIAAIERRFDAAGFTAVHTAVFEDESGSVTGWRVEADRTT